MASPAADALHENSPNASSRRWVAAGPSYWAKRATLGMVRTVLLAALVIGSGVAGGYAVSYPLKKLDLGGPDPVTLDHQALAGVNPELALVRREDLPDSFVEGEEAISNAVTLVGAQYCVATEPPDGQIGDRLSKVFVDQQNQTLLLSEVVRFSRPRQSKAYVDEVTRTLTGCGKFYKEQNGERVQFQVTNPRRNPPVNDYISRTLAPTKGGLTQIVTYFTVGDLVVALQYAGPANPPKSLMDDAEREILYRVAPESFSRVAKVEGLKTEPTTTTTIVDPAAPSPTSSPLPPPTVAPDPTFSSPTSAPKPKKKTSTTTPKPAATPAPAAPAEPAAPAQPGA